MYLAINANHCIGQPLSPETSVSCVNAIVGDDAQGLAAILETIGDINLYPAGETKYPIILKNATLLEFAAFLGAERCFADLLLMGAEARQETALCAAAGGNRTIFGQLLEQNEEWMNGERGKITPIDIAAEFGQLDMVHYLWTKGVHIGDAALSAARSGHLEVLKFCLNNGGRKSAVQNICTFNNACQFGHEEIVEYLLVEEKMKPAKNSAALAAANGNLGTVKLLVKSGFTNIPWEIAAEKGHLDVLKYLVEEVGIDLKKTMEKGSDPVVAAAANGHMRVLRYLIEKCGFPSKSATKSAKQFPIVAAVLGEHTNIVKYLLHSGAPLNEVYRQPTHTVFKSKLLYMPNTQVTLLKIACDTQQYELVKYLIEHGASLRLGQTANALMYTLKTRNFEAMAKLIEIVGIDRICEAGPGNIETLIAVALANGNSRLVEDLFAKHPNIRLKASDLKCIEYSADFDIDSSPVAIAIKQDNIEMVKLLLDHGAMPKTKAGDSNMLAYAVNCSNREAADLLLERAVDFRKSTKIPLALLYSLKQEKPIFAKLFIDNGAQLTPNHAFSEISSTTMLRFVLDDETFPPRQTLEFVFSMFDEIDEDLIKRYITRHNLSRGPEYQLMAEYAFKRSIGNLIIVLRNLLLFDKTTTIQLHDFRTCGNVSRLEELYHAAKSANVLFDDNARDIYTAVTKYAEAHKDGKYYEILDLNALLPRIINAWGLLTVIEYAGDKIDWVGLTSNEKKSLAIGLVQSARGSGFTPSFPNQAKTQNAVNILKGYGLDFDEKCIPVPGSGKRISLAQFMLDHA